MSAIIDRIRAHGGEVIRDKWRITLRRGSLAPDALAWIATQRSRLLREIWPEVDEWEERAAIREYCGGQSRGEAEAAAYEDLHRGRLC